MASCFKGNPFSIPGLRQVISNQTCAGQWKEFTLTVLNTGGTLLILEDGKLDVDEHRLDIVLSYNHPRARFQGQAVLKVTSIHKTKSAVIILVFIISAVHHLILPHRSRHSELGRSPTVPYISTETRQAWPREAMSHQVVTISLCIATSCLQPSSLGGVFTGANQFFISCIFWGSWVSSQTLQLSSDFNRVLSGHPPLGEILFELMEIPRKKQEWHSVTLQPGIAAKVEHDESITDPKAEVMDQSEEERLHLYCKCWAQLLVQYHSKRRIQLEWHAILKMDVSSLLGPLHVVASPVSSKGWRWDGAPLSLQLLRLPQSGIVALLEVWSKLNDVLSADKVNRFQQSMFQLKNADQITAGVSDELIQSESSLDLLNRLKMVLSSVDVCPAPSALLQQINVHRSSRVDPVAELNQDGKSFFRLFLNGSVGQVAVAESAREMANLRLAFCRNVLIGQHLRVLDRKKFQLSPEDAEAIRSELLPREAPLTHACYAFLKVINHPAQIISNSLTEQDTRTMVLLEFKKPLKY